MEKKINKTLPHRLKVAFLSFYSGDIYRGVETYVHELSNRLVDLGVDVTVYQHGATLSNSKYRTVTIKNKIDWNRKSSYLSFVNYYSLRVKKFTREVLSRVDKDTDVIFPTNGQWQSVLCSIWAKRHGKKIVIAGQSGPGIDDRINLWTFPNKFVGLTKPQGEWARSANPFVKSVVIPNGVDLKKFGNKINPLKINLPRPIILCVAAFDYWKRQDLAIKAVSKLKKGSLLLVGRGAEEKKLRELGEKLLPGRFDIMSFPHSEMPKVYSACDLFTYPTVPWESFGIVMVEAMASDLPVVATDDPIRREIVGDAGLFVDPNNTEKYTRALQRALETKWDNKPRKQAEKFSWDDIARKYKELFDKITS